jgi:L-threonylcarbamoyladenylate synthase
MFLRLVSKEKRCFTHMLFSITELHMTTTNMNGHDHLTTAILPVDVRKLGHLNAVPQAGDILDDLDINLDYETEDARNLRQAAQALRLSNIPVAFPTETVYGLGADATRGEAVRGIYKAKQRPSDNPLIVHFASLAQLRAFLKPSRLSGEGKILHELADGHEHKSYDVIPAIYHPLISRFWPGPLTIILPNLPDSKLAPEVTSGLKTFGARMPGNLLALALLKLADVPVAAPSANASTKPSPTAAEHVAHDLDGRINIIIDGGPCDVGVESTVVDGLHDPPLILRPGGISLEQLRTCPGWEGTEIGYKNAAESGQQPKAPGMKYRHYSPRAPVVLTEQGVAPPTMQDLRRLSGRSSNIGLVRTRHWILDISNQATPIILKDDIHTKGTLTTNGDSESRPPGFAGLLDRLGATTPPRQTMRTHSIQDGSMQVRILDVMIGPGTETIARNVFAALRDLDKANVDMIVIEGISDEEGATAAAIMNRVRKAAEVRVAE